MTEHGPTSDVFLRHEAEQVSRRITDIPCGPTVVEVGARVGVFGVHDTHPQHFLATLQTVAPKNNSGGCGTLIGTVAQGCGTGTGGSVLIGVSCGSTVPIWSEFVNAWASVTGDSSLGCIIAEALALITILVVVIVVIWAAALVLRRD